MRKKRLLSARTVEIHRFNGSVSGAMLAERASVH
jgi:hypothetical protein